MVKDSPRITAGELQLLVESWGQKANKKTAPTSPRVIWEGFKKNYSGSSKTKSSIFGFVRHDWNVK